MVPWKAFIIGGSNRKAVIEKELVAIHEIRLPGRHWKMFVFVHKLE